MSSDAIIEGLKQGNTIELGVLQNLKEGLNTVVDGMINECLNRSDGLSELTEKLKLVETLVFELSIITDWCVRIVPLLPTRLRLPRQIRNHFSSTASSEVFATAIPLTRTTYQNSSTNSRKSVQIAWQK